MRRADDAIDAIVAPPVSLAAQRERRARRPAAPFALPAPSDRLLHRVALALNSTLELRDVLGELATVTLEATGADRCSIFLLDGDLLRPAVAVGVRPDEDLWSRFRALGPIDVRDLPLAQELIAAGHAVGVLDARAVELIPPAWVDAFDLRSVVVVPLLSEGHPSGLLALDYQDRHPLGAEESVLLESIAAHAGLAVRNARLFESTRRRAVLQQVLAGSAATLALPLEPAAIAQHVVDACTTMLDTDPAAIGLFDAHGARLTLLAGRRPVAARGAVPIAVVPDRIRLQLATEWAEALRPVWFGADAWFAEFGGDGAPAAERHLVLPLATSGQPRGALVLGFAHGRRPDNDQYAAVEALATIAAAALERAGLLRRMEQGVRRLDLLAGLGGLLAERTTSGAIVARLAEVLADDQVEVAGLVLRDRALARRLGWDAAAGDRVEPDTVPVPMRLGRRTVGTMLVRPTGLEPEDRAFLEALGRGVAETLARAAGRVELDESAQAKSAATVRDRYNAELHETVGELLVALGLLAHRAADELPPDSPWAERVLRLADIARDGKWALDQGDRALAHVPAARRGLPSALRGLARAVESDSGITVAVSVRGRPVAVGAAVEQALYRVAHEALAHAWRHAGCSLVSISLDYEADSTVLRVRDDGIGLELRAGEHHMGAGVRAMRRAMGELGGTLRMTNARPRGVVVEARIGRSR